MSVSIACTYLLVLMFGILTMLFFAELTLGYPFTSKQDDSIGASVTVYPQVYENRQEDAEKILVLEGYSLNLKKASVLADTVILLEVTENGTHEKYEKHGNRAGEDSHRAHAHQQPTHGGHPAEGGTLPAAGAVAGGHAVPARRACSKATSHPGGRGPSAKGTGSRSQRSLRVTAAEDTQQGGQAVWTLEEAAESSDTPVSPFGTVCVLLRLTTHSLALIHCLVNGQKCQYNAVSTASAAI